MEISYYNRIKKSSKLKLNKEYYFVSNFELYKKF